MKFLSIADDVVLGKDVKIFNFVNLYGCKIDDGTKIGTFVEVQKGATIGKNCKISSHTFICEGVHIGDGCFVGHGVLFINDKHPFLTILGVIILSIFIVVAVSKKSFIIRLIKQKFKAIKRLIGI